MAKAEKLPRRPCSIVRESESIIDQETFDIVQRIRDGRRRLTPMGEMPILSGMVFCADCGAKLYQVRGRKLPQSEYMVCATYRKKGKHICTSHQIRNSVIEELLLSGIREITGYVRENEAEFVEMITKKSKAEADRGLREAKRELEQSKARIHKLDDIIQKLYENNVDGKISDDRFIRLVKKYTDVQELNAEIIREFVDKIYIYKAERIGGKKVQKIKILWNCIGEFMPPKKEKTAQPHLHHYAVIFQG